MTEPNSDAGLEFEVWGMKMTARGAITIIAVCVLLIVMSNLYVGVQMSNSMEAISTRLVAAFEMAAGRIERAQAEGLSRLSTEHRDLQRAGALVACVNSITDKSSIRDMRAYDDFRRVCPWLP